MSDDQADAARSTSFSARAEFEFEVRASLGLAVEGASDPGEVLAATATVRRNDREAWFAAWRDLAERTREVAQTAAEAGHRVSASEAFLRSSGYFAVALGAASALDNAHDLYTMFMKQQDTWEAFVAYTSVAVERVDIPCALTSLPGYFFRPVPSAHGSGATLVAVNSTEGSFAALWATCVSAALKRGYNVLVFDGPGQQSQLFERHVPLRPDWENVLTPVYDFVSQLQGVAPSRVALYGVDQGGFWVARALAFEHRFVAAIADPGVVEFCARPYRTTGHAETIEPVSRYTLTEQQAAQIRTPLLITETKGERFRPGQSNQLALLTAHVSTPARPTATDGAGGARHPMARALATQYLFDWLDEQDGLIQPKIEHRAQKSSEPSL